MSTEFKEKEEQYKFHHNNESNWLWGIFYCNRKDPRVFVPKKNKNMGLTLNIAHPVAIVVFVIILAVIIYFLVN